MLVSSADTATTVTPDAAKHVVLIGFDGFDPSYLGRVPTPNLDRIAAEGVQGTTQGVMLPITTPSFTALATGTWPVTNGTLTYYYDRATNTFHTSSPPSRVPTIAEAVRDAGGTVGAAQYFAFRGNGTAYGDADGLYTQPGGECSNMFDDAIAMLRTEPVDSNGTTVTMSQMPTLLGVYCPQLDHVGHDQGAESPQIATALAELDAQVGRLLDTLDDLGIADDTTVIVTGDHGMSTYTQRYTLPLYTALGAAGYDTQALLLDGQPVDPDADVLVVPAAGRDTSIYLVGDLAGDAAALADITRISLQTEGVARVFDRDDQAAMHMNPEFGDLILEGASGWSSGILPVDHPMGDHGSTSELDAAFFMAGAGVTPRAEPVQVCHVNVAPTIASLLGLPPLPDADGGALDGDYDDIEGCPLVIPGDETSTTTTTTEVPATTTSTTSDPTTSTTPTPSTVTPSTVTPSTAPPEPTSSTTAGPTTPDPTPAAPTTTGPATTGAPVPPVDAAHATRTVPPHPAPVADAVAVDPRYTG
ncbi:MAG TPA: alkaline phosphatase family protein [Acidimicrobiales bacterium]|nr:alkaline phosphatase family protein [Acidimicrobiales bacterium]